MLRCMPDYVNHLFACAPEENLCLISYESAVLRLLSRRSMLRKCSVPNLWLVFCCVKSISQMGKMYSGRLWIWKRPMIYTIDRHGMWLMLRVYGVGGKLLKAVQSFYVDSRACVRVGNDASEWFPVNVLLRQNK